MSENMNPAFKEQKLFLHEEEFQQKEQEEQSNLFQETFTEQQETTVSTEEQVNLTEISAEQIKIKEHGEDYMEPSTIQIAADFINAEAQEKGTFKSLGLALKFYYSQRDSMGGDKLDDVQKADNLRNLIRLTMNIQFQCNLYIVHHHPITKRGKKRKKQVTALKQQVESEMDLLQQTLDKLQISEAATKDVNREARMSYGISDIKAALKEQKEGGEKIALLKKSGHLMESDKSRLAEKDFLKNNTESDLIRTGVTKPVKNLLKKITQYSDIHTTVSHLKSSSKLMSEADTGSEENSALKKKFERQRDKLNRERDLITEIRSEINSLLETEKNESARKVLEKYKKRFESTLDGKLEVDEAKVLEYKDDVFYKSHVITDKEVKKAKEQGDDSLVAGKVLTKEVETWDRSDEPLFAHEPCTQDIVQGSMGDCYFLSSLAKVVSSNPDSIRKMMKDEGDKVTVRFFRKIKDPKNANAPVSFEPAYIRVSKVVADDGASDTLWVKLMEKAFAVFSQSFPGEAGFENSDMQKIRKEHDKQKAKSTDNILDFGFMSNGGWMDETFESITGEASQERITVNNNLALYGATTSVKDLTERFILKNPGNDYVESFNGDFYFKDLFSDVEELSQKSLQAHADEFANLDKLEKENSKKLKDLEAKSKAETNAKKQADPEWVQLDTECKKLLDDYNKDNSNVDAIMKHAVLTSRMNAMERKYKPSDEIVAEQKALQEKRDYYRHVKAMEKRANIGKVPPEKQAAVRRHQATMMTNAGNSIIDIIKKKLGIKEISKGAAAKEDCIKILNEVKALKFEDNANGDYIDKQQMWNLGDALGIMDDDIVFQKAKDHVLHLLGNIVDNFEKLYDPDEHIPFSGVYSDEAKKIFEDIKDAISKKRLLGCGSRELEGAVSQGYSGETTNGGLVGGHAYSILGTDTVQYEGKEIKMIKLRNPWGVHVPVYKKDEKTGRVISVESLEKTNGTFLCELTQFMQTYANIYQGG